MIETSVFEAWLVEPNSTLREFFCKNRTAFDNPLFQSPGCVPYSRLFSPSYGFGFNHPNVENLKLESENFGKEVSCSFHNWHFLTDSFFSLDTDDWVERYRVEIFVTFLKIFFSFLRMRNVAEQSIKVSFYLSPTVLANGKYCERLQYHAIEFNTIQHQSFSSCNTIQFHTTS